MIKQMIKRCTLIVILLICMIFGTAMTTVFAVDDVSSEYEAKVIINEIPASNTPTAQYYFSTVEEAFSMAATKESEHNPQGKSGKITVTIQLLKDVEVETTLIANANKSNLLIDVNGCSITSSADPVIQAGIMTFITNSAETSCYIIQKDVSTISSVSPNTVIYAPSSVMVLNINAKNLTIGNDTGTIINSQAMLPSIQNGIFLGEMIIGKPMFGAAITGGYFSKDPTAHIDQNSYVAVMDDEGMYYLIKYHAATVDSTSGEVLQKYAFLQEAVDSTTTDGRVKLLKQDYPPETVTIASDDKLTLDLAGFQLTGAASPLAAIRVEGTSLIHNQGTLSIVDTDESDPGALNFVYSENFEGNCFCTILNQGILNLNGVSVSVNYNQPNYLGKIYTLCNDSSNGNAQIYIDSESKVGGIKLEPEDPATGKYPAIMTMGNGNYINAVHVEYAGKDITSNTDNDTVTFYVENSTIGEVMNVFDDDGNYTTTLSLNGESDLQKRNISVKKDGIEIKFEYDSLTDILVIPASAFTDETDVIEISLKYQVTYIADNKTVQTLMVEYGKDASMPEVPAKDGYTGKWDNDGKNITKDTTITAVYTAISQDVENDTENENKGTIDNSTEKGNEDITSIDTGDHSNIELWLAMFFVSFVILAIFVIYKRKVIKKNL